MEEQKSKKKGNPNKRKGSNAERLYMNEFRNMGFTKCVTSRFGSRLADDAKIDLINLPVNVQIKAGYKRVGVNPVAVLKEMKQRIEELYPETALETKYPSILIHHKDGISGVPRTEFDSMVSMTFESFKKLMALAYPSQSKQ